MKIMFLKALKYILFFIPIKDGQLFVIPDSTMRDEPCGITNYTNDNVLIFLHFLFFNKDSFKTKIKTVYVVGANSVLHDDCLALQEMLKNIKLQVIDDCHLFRNVFSILKYYLYLFSSQIIINPTPMASFLYKRNKQIVITLPYYSAPFKSDVIKNSYATKSNSIDYVIAASDFSGRMDLCASQLSYFKYIPLGSMRHDCMLKPRYTFAEIKRLLCLPADCKKIIAYAPTHRDGLLPHVHSALIGCSDFIRLNTVLKEYDAFLIIKMHQGMLNDTLKGIDGCSNLLVYTPSKYYTFYDILSHADLLITDYSSIYFDFLVTGKPVIFNFCDRIEYEESRGLSYNPVELFCAGKIVNTEEELYAAVEDELSGKTYKNDKHYNDVKNLFIKYTDGKTCERVYDFICKKIAK